MSEPMTTSMNPTQQVPSVANQLTSESVANSVANVSMSSTIMTSNGTAPQNCMPSAANVVQSSSTMPSVMTPASIVTMSSASQQHLVSSSQTPLISTAQTQHMNASNALMAQTLTSMANQTVQSVQMGQHSQLLQTQVQPSLAMSSLPQVQMIGQPMGTSGGTYQFQQVFPSQVWPGNQSIQIMPFGAGNQQISLQLPFTGATTLNTATMPMTSIAAKQPIMSKGVTISSMPHSQQIRPNLANHTTQQIIKQLPTQQFIPHSTGSQIVISQILPQHNQHPLHQSILPNNKTMFDTNKGKPFGMGSVRSFGNKMLSHSGAIQPKSPILPATATSMSSPLMANSQFKNPFQNNANTAQLIGTPSNFNLTNQQILGAFQVPQGITWATGPQSTHLVGPNGSPIFIRNPNQMSGTEQMFISSPQIQTVSMSAPMNVQNTSAQMPMNATPHTQSITPMTQTLQHISNQMANINANTTTASVATASSQPTAIAPAPTPPITTKARNIRNANTSVSIATQTAAPTIAHKQHVESSTPLKPIAPAKPKPSPQPLVQLNTKPVNKDLNATIIRSTGVGSTQTSSQTAAQQSTKNDASNQSNRVSVATETPKTNSQSQVSSSRHINDQNKPTVKSNTTTNTSTDLIQTKVNSSAEEVKTPTKRAIVEKKDASTGEDSEVMNNFYSQQNHKLLHNSIQSTQTIHVSNMNQTNGPQIAVLSDLNRQDISATKQPPQKAIVKPQILTHVIDGYIIQESPNPFPVNGMSYSSDQKLVNDEKNNTIVSIETLKPKNKNENSINANIVPPIPPRNRLSSDKHLCLNCGQKRKNNSKNNKNFKKFCSELCSKKYNDKNSPNSPRLGLYNSVTAQLDTNDLQRNHDLGNELSANDIERQTIDERKKRPLKRSQDIANDFNSSRNGDIDDSIERNHRKLASNASVETPSANVLPIVNPPDESNANVNSATAGLYIPPGGRNPLQWSVNDVYEFVRNLQGCTEYADDFRSQEIDGQALMLIKEDHLMNTMSMKLGPALKICSKINALREDCQRQS